VVWPWKKLFKTGGQFILDSLTNHFTNATFQILQARTWWVIFSLLFFGIGYSLGFRLVWKKRKNKIR